MPFNTINAFSEIRSHVGPPEAAGKVRLVGLIVQSLLIDQTDNPQFNGQPVRSLRLKKKLSSFTAIKVVSDCRYSHSVSQQR